MAEPPYFYLARQPGASDLTQPRPAALPIYRNPAWGYSLRHPDSWHLCQLDVDGGQGVLFTPDPLTCGTALSVEVRRLGTDVTPDDLPDLEHRFLTDLEAAPRSQVEQRQAFANEFTTGIEAVQTYDEAGTRRKRWIRLIYKGSVQARVIAQGATVEEFDRLRPLFGPCVTTFMLGDAS